MPPPDPASLARTLSRLAWRDLFQRLDNAIIGPLWQQGATRPALESIALGSQADPHARFLAAEILFARAPGFPPPNAIPSLATLYAEALKDAPRFPANPWGMPDAFDEPVALHVFKLGTPAAQALTPLLDDPRPVRYEGSKEATLGNNYRYRVKDLAASLIAGIRHLTFAPDLDPEQRDEAIRDLKKSLDAAE